MNIISLSVSEAKAGFSNLIQQICDHGDYFIIKKRGKPVARIVPFSSEGMHKAAGALAAYANPQVSEEGAFEEAIVKKHASDY